MSDFYISRLKIRGGNTLSWPNATKREALEDAANHACSARHMENATLTVTAPNGAVIFRSSGEHVGMDRAELLRSLSPKKARRKSRRR